MWALLALVLATWPTISRADIIPNSVASCRNSDEGDKCRLDGGGRGTCQKATCSRLDYSDGPPPKSVAYDCLKCMRVRPKSSDKEKNSDADAVEKKQNDETSNDENSDDETSDDEASDEKSSGDETSDEESSGDTNSPDPEEAATEERSALDSDRKEASPRQISPDADDSTSMLVTSGSIGLGLFFLAAVFWRRRGAEE